MVEEGPHGRTRARKQGQGTRIQVQSTHTQKGTGVASTQVRVPDMSQALVMTAASTPVDEWSQRARMGAPERGAGCASTRPHGMGTPFRACIGSSCQGCARSSGYSQGAQFEAGDSPCRFYRRDFAQRLLHAFLGPDNTQNALCVGMPCPLFSSPARALLCSLSCNTGNTM